MKIRSIELRNFRKFVGSVRVDGIGDGVNILFGPNEYGKSTLLEAINGVIFEKATAQAERTRAFRHFANGTVPEVELAFDLNRTRWTVHKRFSGQSGRVVLTDANGRRFDGDAAETELQKLLGFTRGPRNSEPGIWGTLWVQQGRSFVDVGLDERGRRSLQRCLEAQVGIITGGQRGRRIPEAVESALSEIKSTRGPRGKFKDAINRLADARERTTQLKAKCDEIFAQMDELARLRRERQRRLAEWNADASQAELEELRERRGVAATKATEISKARSDAKLARERAERAKAEVEERASVVAELEPLQAKIRSLRSELDETENQRETWKRQLDAAETRLTELRPRQRENNDEIRRLERVRAACMVDTEIKDHQDTLARGLELKREVARLTEAIGANPATDEKVLQIEDAAVKRDGAHAAVNAVATTLSFVLDPSSVVRVKLAGKPVSTPVFSLPVLTETTIGIDGIGHITVEPQIANRQMIVERVRSAEELLAAALDAAGAPDLPAVRRNAGIRRDLVRQLTTKEQEISGLAPADRARKLPAGLEARENLVSELKGRLAKELEVLELECLPPLAEIEDTISTTHDDGASISRGIDAAEAQIEEPKRLFTETLEVVRDLNNEISELSGALAEKQAQLAARRSRRDDQTLSVQVKELEQAAADADTTLVALVREQGETIDEIDGRIRRLETVREQHKNEIARLNREIAHSEGALEANEGFGAEERLDTAQAEQSRIETQVKAYEEEAEVLELLRDKLRAAESDAKQKYLAPVAKRTEPYLRMLLPDTGLLFDEELSINGIQRRDTSESFSILSVGTQEQLAVLARLAFAELLIDQERPAAVILDDALVFSDDDRIERMFDILMRAGEKVQIIVLTCRQRLFTRLGALPLQLLECTHSA